MKELDRRVARLEQAFQSQGAEQADSEEEVLRALEGYAKRMSIPVDQVGRLSEQFLPEDRRTELQDERTDPDRRAILFLQGLAKAKASRAKVYRGGPGASR